MKPNELTQEMFDKMVFDDLVNSCHYSPEDARKLMDRFPDVLKEHYEQATNEKKFMLGKRNVDAKSLNFFKNGNYIKSDVSGTAMCLDLLW